MPTPFPRPLDTLPRNPFEDPALEPYRPFLQARSRRFAAEAERIRSRYGSLRAYANLHRVLGPHLLRRPGGGRVWRWREYLPQAEAVWLVTDKGRFQRHARCRFQRLAGDIFELVLPEAALGHGSYVELRVQPRPQDTDNNTSAAEAGLLKRVPAFAVWVDQDALTPTQWCARIWRPEQPYRFRRRRPARTPFPRIYEAHVGMAQADTDHHGERVGSYTDFIRQVLPRIKADGYTAVQLMGILEHPLYRSFGYQVSSYFAPTSRCGTPDQFKALVDAAHGLGLAVLLDIPHGHACPNTEQGLAAYDGSPYFFKPQYNQWGTPSFDFNQETARRFLLSNCRYWLEEFRVDGFRFDAVGNILYLDHGLDDDFSHAGRCFYGKDNQPRADADGELYLCLANALTHEIYPAAVTIAEEFSGMPGLTCPPEAGGLGFDYRFAMGIPDYWAKCVQSPRDMGSLWHEMTNHRPYDRTISYVECHDQCINGEDAMIWRLLGPAMYTGMGLAAEDWKISRGLAFYRLRRLITLAPADAGYLNFMGNEFGHPEWLDAEAHAHRLWRLAERSDLKYAALAAWDKAQLLELVRPFLCNFSTAPLFRYIHEDKRLLAFERGRLLLAFNFHELTPNSDVTFGVTPGRYVELLSSDEPRFAGHGNLDPRSRPTEHFTRPGGFTPKTGLEDITLYLPPLVGLALYRT